MIYFDQKQGNVDLQEIPITGDFVITIRVITNYMFDNLCIVVYLNIRQFVDIYCIYIFVSVSRIQQGRQREPSVHTSFRTFCRILEVLRVEWQNSTPRLTSTPERRDRNINLSKYFISSSGDRAHNQSVLESYFGSLRRDWPQSNGVIVSDGS